MANKPNPEDLAARQKAIDAGETQYVRPSNGERYTIRNLGNRRHKKNYGGQGGRDEKYVARSGNRGNKVDNPRAFNLRHGSPPGTDIAEGDRAMARIRQQFPGMDADHINDIALSSAGASWKVQQGRGTYEDYFENMRRAGIPVGHTAENLAPLDPHLNQIVKNQDTQRVHRAIQESQGSFRGLTFKNGVATLDFGSKPTQPVVKPVAAKPKPKTKPKTTKPKLRFGGGAVSGLFGGTRSGSEIVDRVNENMNLTAPHLADIGFEFF